MTELRLIGVLMISSALLAAGCSRSTIDGRKVLCSQSASMKFERVEQVPRDEWLRLIVGKAGQGDAGQGEDCTGHAFEPSVLPLRCISRARTGGVKDLPLQAEALEVRALSDTFALVSLPVEEFSNGDMTLLVALVHASRRSVSVVAIGSLQLHAAQLELELRPMGGEELLFARGSECAAGSQESKCDTQLKMLMLYQGRFVPLELRNSDNRCTGEAEISLFRSQDVRLKSRWRRTFELVSTYDVQDEGIVVNEQLVAMDRPPDGNPENAREFRRSDAIRELKFNGAYFTYERESLWDGMREVRGDLQTNKTQSYRD
ncbi:MAG: hypothetical protein AAF500_12875 [Myxococcota bacterium]